MKVCTVYRSDRHDQMYLYVERSEGLGRVPAALRERFGNAEEVMTMPLTTQRKLSRVSAASVLDAIAAEGYFLQMPPVGSDLPELAGHDGVYRPPADDLTRDAASTPVNPLGAGD